MKRKPTSDKGLRMFVAHGSGFEANLARELLATRRVMRDYVRVTEGPVCEDSDIEQLGKRARRVLPEFYGRKT